MMKTSFTALLLAAGCLVPFWGLAQAAPTFVESFNLLNAETAYRLSEEELFPGLPGARVTDAARSHTGAAAVQLGTRPGADSLVSKLVQVRRARQLIFTAWVRLENVSQPGPAGEVGGAGRHFLQVNFYNQVGRLVASRRAVADEQKVGWQQLTLTVPVWGQGFWRLLLGASAPALFDDVRLVRRSLAPPVATVALSLAAANATVKNFWNPNDDTGPPPKDTVATNTVLLPPPKPGEGADPRESMALLGAGPTDGKPLYNRAGQRGYNHSFIKVANNVVGQLAGGARRQYQAVFKHAGVPDMRVGIIVSRDAAGRITGYRIAPTSADAKANFSVSKDVVSDMDGLTGQVNFTGYLMWKVPSPTDNILMDKMQLFEYNLSFRANNTVVVKEKAML